MFMQWRNSRSQKCFAEVRYDYLLDRILVVHLHRFYHLVSNRYIPSISHRLSMSELKGTSLLKWTIIALWSCIVHSKTVSFCISSWSTFLEETWWHCWWEKTH
jgi:hypothetical protein